MKRLSVILTILLALGFASLAQAQATRTWVSGVGDDVNPCSRTAPCKTFAGAISKTASPGIINCLDPGGFGAVTITKSIEIDCHYTLGSILSSGVQGVIINGTTTDDVVLRGLAINGSGVTLGTNGISVTQARSVHVFDSNVAKYSGNAIRVVNTSNAIQLITRNVQLLNITGNCINLAPTGTGTVSLDMSDSSVTRCGGNGIDVAGTGNTAIVKNSVFARITAAAFQVQQTSSSGAVESSNLSFNGTGVQAGVAANTPAVRLSRNLITANTVNGVAGSTTCFGTNVIAGNTGSNTCATPNAAQQ